MNKKMIRDKKLEKILPHTLVLLLAGCIMLTLMSCQNEVTDDKPVRVILDTDFAPDVDDAVALAQLHGLAGLGECEIIATIHTASCEYSAGVMSAFNDWHGHKVPVGAIQRDGLPERDTPCNIWLGDYATPLYYEFSDLRYEGLRNDVTSSTTLYRQLLSDAGENKVTIVTIGFLNGIKQLLKSDGDHLDDRNGVELVKEQVDKIVIMGGSTKDGHRSWNFHGSNTDDVIDAAAYVFENWPDEDVPMHFVAAEGENHNWGSSQWERDPEADDIRTAYSAPEQDPDHILYRALEEFGGVHNGSGIHLADPATVLYVVRPERFVIRTGTQIWAGDGRTYWMDDEEGLHTVIDGYVGTGTELMNELEVLTWTPRQNN